MLQIQTRDKVAGAAFLSYLVQRWRGIYKKPPTGRFTRGGIVWDLDLREGIDFAIFVFGRFEPETVGAYARLLRAGCTVVDIGANIGAHTLCLASLVEPAGKVLAFEPTEYALRKLLKNTSLNPRLAGCVDARQVFLAARAADPTEFPLLYSSWPLAPISGVVHAKHCGMAMGAATARQNTLDQEIGDTPVHLIKLDVDGFECGVLRGAMNVLQTSRPIIILELAPYQLDETGSSIEDLVEILKTFNYVLTDLSGKRALPLDGEALRKLIPEGSSRNAIARVLR